MGYEVSSKELGKILGITTRRVNQIADEGEIFQREISGNFDVVKCVEQYYRNKFLKDEDVIEYKKEQALHEKAKREKAELQLAKMKGELHRAETVELVLTNMLVTFRNRILGVPSKIAPFLIGQTNISKISEIIDSELREVLTELSEYDPEMFADEEDEFIEGDDNAEDYQPVQENIENSSATPESESQ